ncbi:MAG: hypothetical protein ACKV2T_25060 [Kofleriaceae bacterium]
MNRTLLVVAVSACALVPTRLAFADAEMDAYVAAIKDATGDDPRSQAIAKLVTFKLGKKCWAKLPDKNQGAVHLGTFASRDLLEYGKLVTGEEMTETSLDAFRQKFSITVNVEGDDCDAKQNSLWLGYWSGAISAVKNYPPPSGKAFITINVGKQKELVNEVAKDGSTFTINGPKDIAAKEWNDKLEKPFRQLVANIPDNFAFAVKETTGDFYSAWVLTKFHTFKIGKKCRAKLANKDEGAVHAASFATRDIAAWAKAAGAEDWDAVEGQSNNDPKYNRDLVEKDMDAFKKRFSVTVIVDGDDCDAKQSSLWLRYWTTIVGALEDYPPKAKNVKITLTVTAKAKQMSANVGKDGATFAFTGPRDVEKAMWSDVIVKAFEKVKKK